MTAWKKVWTQWECEDCGERSGERERRLADVRRQGRAHAKQHGHTVRLTKLVKADL